MKLWRFDEPYDHSFATVSIVGTWSNSVPSELIHPLVIEWEPESDVIGDFTWSFGFGDEVVVTERAGKALLERFRGIELGPVEMIQNPKLKRPQRITRRTKHRVWLPYEGPTLYELCVIAQVNADIERSTLKPIGIHPDFGYMRYEIEGCEEIDWVGEFPNEIKEVRVPRKPGKGVYVRKTEIKNAKADIFYVVQLPGYIYCTEEVRQFILEKKFTNIDFFEMGEIF